MSTVLAIDPGSADSAFARIDVDTCRPIEINKVPNADLLQYLRTAERPADELVSIEMVASYGMPVGREVFETCVWIGRFGEAVAHRHGEIWLELQYRRDVKLHHCQSSRAKDANVIQALVDRFAAGEPNRGKGTKATPGWFYGFSADIWQAYALAVLVADREAGRK